MISLVAGYIESDLFRNPISETSRPQQKGAMALAHFLKDSSKFDYCWYLQLPMRHLESGVFQNLVLIKLHFVSHSSESNHCTLNHKINLSQYHHNNQDQRHSMIQDEIP